MSLETFWALFFCPILSQLSLVTLPASSHFLLSNKAPEHVWVPTVYLGVGGEVQTRRHHFAIGLCLASLEVCLQAASLLLENSSRSRRFLPGRRELASEGEAMWTPYAQDCQFPWEQASGIESEAPGLSTKWPGWSWVVLWPWITCPRYCMG